MRSLREKIRGEYVLEEMDRFAMEGNWDNYENIAKDYIKRTIGMHDLTIRFNEHGGSAGGHRTLKFPISMVEASMHVVFWRRSKKKRYPKIQTVARGVTLIRRSRPVKVFIVNTLKRFRSGLPVRLL